MFNLDPLSRPVAVVEMLLLLALAAFVGWFLARLLVANRINALRSVIADQEAKLNDCRQANVTASRPVPKSPGPAFVEPLKPAPAPVVLPPLAVAPEPTEPVVSPTEGVLNDAPLALAPERPLIDPVVPMPPVVGPAAASGSEASVLQRIAARANELNFDRIGLATAAQADDLKDIVGIGPFLERKLHSLGIYTFRQIANFEKEDIDKVNDIIEFFPGRIERDNWVDQSRVFYERKYGR